MFAKLDVRSWHGRRVLFTGKEEQVMFRYLLTLVACVVVASSAFSADPVPRYNGKPLEYWVERLQKAETNELQSEAARAIADFGPDAKPAIPKLMEMLDDRAIEFRSKIYMILHQLGPNASDAVPYLVKLLKENKARDPEEVIYTLKWIGPSSKDAIPVLVAALSKAELRGAAIQGLCAIGPDAKSAVPEIKKALIQQSTRELVKRNEWRAYSFVSDLPKLGEDVVPLLIELLKEDDPFVEASAAALGEMGSKANGAIPLLKGKLSHKDPDVRFETANALWRISKDESALPVFVALFEEGSDRINERALMRLQEIGPEAHLALPSLRGFLKRLDTIKGMGGYVNSKWAASIRELIQKIESQDAGSKK